MACSETAHPDTRQKARAKRQPNPKKYFMLCKLKSKNPQVNPCDCSIQGKKAKGLDSPSNGNPIPEPF